MGGEYVLWGRREGSRDWEEEVLYVSTMAEEVERAKEIATLKGYIDLRVMYNDGSPPNFARAIKI